MAPKKCTKNKFIKAKIASDNKAPCVFCQRKIDDEITYGKLYTIGGIQCHYFCVLLSSCLIQKGRDEDGLFGFLYDDILAEVDRSKKHRCSYCGHSGASLGCSVAQCKKQFHLPCGRDRNAVSLFFGNYKSFCEQHAPKQVIPDDIMARVKIRTRDNCTINKKTHNVTTKDPNTDNNDACGVVLDGVCVICYEQVSSYRSTQSFWPPCCARDAWFHRQCLQRMALSAGVHYLKCPLCNDKENFYEAIVSQGYYVPDRDAAWELEQNAFSEIYDRSVTCSAVECLCPMGRRHDAENGPYTVKVCMLCGSSGAHAGCLPADTHPHLVCGVCRPAAPADLDTLANNIETVIQCEEQRQRERERCVRQGPRMPSRMSLRRTKSNAAARHIASCSSQNAVHKIEIHSQSLTTNTVSSRHDLNLKTPKKLAITFSPSKQTDVYNSPMKLIQEGLRSKGESGVISDAIAEELRKKLLKPTPLFKKKKIVNDILNDLFDNLLKEPKHKEPLREWCSPKKISDIKEEIKEETTPSLPNKQAFGLPVKPNYDSESSNSTFELPSEFIADSNDSYPIPHTPKKLKTFDINNSSLEISEKNETINIDVCQMPNTSQNGDYLKNFEVKSPFKSEKCAFKFSPTDKEVLANDNIDIDLECFKNHYLNEVTRDKVKKRKQKRKVSDEIVLKYKSEKNGGKKSNKKDIQVKIKWRKEHFKLRIKEKRNKIKTKQNKQYVLKYSLDDNSRIAKTMTPKKRKCIKHDKTPDNLKQTSIDSFFKVKPAKE